MENKYIIVFLLVIIVVLAVAIGFALVNPMNAKEPTKINITSEKSQYEGGELSVQLTDLNDTPISKEIVNLTIEDSNGNVTVDDVVKTDLEGKAKLDLDLDKGNYTVSVTYDGNENYTGNNATQNLTIEEEAKTTEVQSTQTQSAGSDSSQQSSQRQEDQVTPDGWDPKEHEVSRESLEDGYERVKYDDGYMRVVDEDGNVLSHGWT